MLLRPQALVHTLYTLGWGGGKRGSSVISRIEINKENNNNKKAILKTLKVGECEHDIPVAISPNCHTTFRLQEHSLIYNL